MMTPQKLTAPMQQMKCKKNNDDTKKINCTYTTNKKKQKQQQGMQSNSLSKT